MTDVEDVVRALVATGSPVPPADAARLLDRIARRDGCHARESAIREAAEQVVSAVANGTILTITTTTTHLVSVLDACRHRKPEPPQ